MLESFKTTHIYDYYQLIFLSLNLYLCTKKGKNVLTKRSNIVRILLNNMIPSRPCLLNCIFFCNLQVCFTFLKILAIFEIICYN